MELKTLLEQINKVPESLNFNDVIATIDANYTFSPSAFKNGQVENAANTNNGSCKILGFAKLHQLSTQQTLHCFGDYYRKDVLENPNGNDHLNIRNFMIHGWEGVYFNDTPLTSKA